MKDDDDVLSIDPKHHLACLTLLREALPLALQKLYDGHVSAEDQGAFWRAVHELEDYGDVVDNDCDVGSLDDSFLKDIDTLWAVLNGTERP